MSVKKKSITLSAFRKEINAKDPDFRKHSIEHKHALFTNWLRQQPGVTEKQYHSWIKVNPWLKRDRSHEGR